MAYGGNFYVIVPAVVDGVLDTLRAATSVNAGLLGRDDLGHIRVGAAADLLIFDTDPFASPPALWAATGRTVVRGGRVLS